MESKSEMPKGNGLQLKRKVGEAILLTVNGVKIRVTVRWSSRSEVKLSVLADRTVKIDRLGAMECGS
jgi:sRNA-binding carbon storage regulator CsrA